MKKKKLLLLLILLVVIALYFKVFINKRNIKLPIQTQIPQNTQEKTLDQSIVNKSTLTANILISEDSNIKQILTVIEKELPIWTNQWQRQLPNFSIKSLEKEKEEEMFVLSESEYDSNAKNSSREKLYIFSPDRTKFLDIYLGMDLIEENGKTIAAFDADSGVSFIDIKNNKVKLLSMWGPSSGGCQDAIWLNNNIFVLLGYERNYLDETKEEILPFVRIYDLLKNKTIFYKCPQNIIKHPTESLPMSRIEYQKSKFPDIWRGITVE